eukprot:TRINITY_DN13369_c0_g1_i1.p2 TRINITY_DN13369_c0_g1~~TRINITY_DN13369_c0_g1_i1.p2  ORF type:complete len:101 (+),score=10.63 TRINITY_DN13369_c0_g1_i1:245-547(+)
MQRFGDTESCGKGFSISRDEIFRLFHVCWQKFNMAGTAPRQFNNQLCGRSLLSMPPDSIHRQQKTFIVSEYKRSCLLVLSPYVLCVDTGRSSETAKAHRG